jgi:hypothetical protein
MSKKAELIGSHFPTIYLTVISLLQGIVLSQLIPNIIKYTEIAEHPWTDVHLLPLLLMLLTIFIVWHHYAIGIFFLRWFPNIIDTIFPFVISIGQFFLLSFLDITNSVNDVQVEAWTMGYALILIMGGLPYFASAWRSDPGLFTNIMSKENAIRHVAVSKKYFSLGGWSTFFQGFVAFVIAIMERYDLLFVSLILLLGHIVLFEFMLLRTVKPQFVKGIDEFDAQEK